MTNFSKILALAAAMAALASCGKAKICGNIKDMNGGKVTVRLLDINKYKVLDTVKVGRNGNFSYKIDVKAGQPEFVYVTRNDRNIAAAILNKGDRVRISTDTLGNYTTEGSEESEKLRQVDREFNDFLGRVNALTAVLEKPDLTEEEALECRKNVSKEYIDYYRSRVKYVLANSKSLSVVPVLFQKLSDDFPVFNQPTDAMIFSSTSDSLSVIYPKSRYVAALKNEARNRQSIFEMSGRLNRENALGYLDMELPSVNGTKVKLSSMGGKVVLVNFWSAETDGSKMYNQDVLIPVYKAFKDKGLQIYSINIGTDKALWSQTVKMQGLEWTNVCDGLGAASPAAAAYNVRNVPYNFFIVDGSMIDNHAMSLKDINALLGKYLR